MNPPDKLPARSPAELKQYAAKLEKQYGMTDFEIHDQGNIILLQPLTSNARDWIENNLDSEALTFDETIAVEPRHIIGVLNGIAADGLSFIGINGRKIITTV